MRWRAMNWGVGAPFASPCLMRAFVNTISVSLTVRSSSFEAPSWATEGRMQTGGTEIYCHTNSSGLPHEGCNPSNSQSWHPGIKNKSSPYDKLHTSSDIRRKRSNTFNGFRSSCIALLIYVASSFCASTAGAKVFFHFSISSAVFFARNLSWIILCAPAFLTAPLVAEQ